VFFLNKIIGIWNSNIFYSEYVRDKLIILGYECKILDMINDDLRELYEILEETLWTTYELKEFLENKSLRSKS